MIHVLMIYEKVNLVMPLEQRRFFNFLNDTLILLKAKYRQPDEELLLDASCIKDAEDGNEDENSRCNECFNRFVMSLDEYIPIREFYSLAIVDNILFLAGAGEEYKAQFEADAESAHNAYWRRKSRSGHIKRAGW